MALPCRPGLHIADIDNEEDGVDDAAFNPETPAVTHDGIDEEEGRVGEPDISGVALGADVQVAYRSVGFVAHDFAAHDFAVRDYPRVYRVRRSVLCDGR